MGGVVLGLAGAALVAATCLAAAAVIGITSAGRESRSMTGVQPSGTVTLVFTDVDGSTKLLEGSSVRRAYR